MAKKKKLYGLDPDVADAITKAAAETRGESASSLVNKTMAKHPDVIKHLKKEKKWV